MNAFVTLIFSLLSLLSLSGFALAAEEHRSHTHGLANLTMAYENGVIEIQFEAPAESLWGFEHKPKTQEQVDVIDKAKAILNTPKNILSFNTNNCVASSVVVDVFGPAGETLVNKHHHDDHENHSHAGHNETNSSHSEARAVYVFNCTGKNQLMSVKTTLFEHFPNLEKINVAWLTATQQGKSILRANSSTFELK